MLRAVGVRLTGGWIVNVGARWQDPTVTKEIAPPANLDRSARAGLLLAAVAVGRSYQPNLLTRATNDQAIISGVSAASAYALGTSGNSLLTAISRRFTGGRNSPVAMALVDAGVSMVALAGVTALKWQEHESGRRALARLGFSVTAAAGLSGLASTAAFVAAQTTSTQRARAGVLLGSVVGAGIASWVATMPWRQAPGSEISSGVFYEDKVRRVSAAKAAGIGVVVTGLTFGLARAESGISSVGARLAAAVVGGRAADHRTAGRISAAIASGSLGWAAMTLVTAKLTKGGDGMEVAHSIPPQIPEVTGSPDSGVPWSKLTREGRRWLSMALTPAGINAVMGTSDAKQPIRVYASLPSAADEVERAKLLLSEIDRTQALRRKVFALFSPTGSGYINYVANETLEYLTGGDCASAAIQYSVLPSSLSLTKVPTGTAQTRMVLEGIMSRIRAMPEDQRPRFLLFGESLGSQVSEEMFRDTHTFGLMGSGIDAALWIGTPAATEWRDQIWGDRSVADPPQIGPEVHDHWLYLPRAIKDWQALPAADRAKVRYLLLQNGDDPIPKFDAPLLWRRPPWLGPEDRRPPGSPRGTAWMPVATFFATFFDMANALVPTPGIFAEGGHDYRQVLPKTIREVWQLDCDEEQLHRIEQALRQRELAWELNRQWAAANAEAADKASEARQKVLAKASDWVGHELTADELQSLVAVGLQPTPAPTTPPLASAG